jgi:SPP1 gp7 family putative phage head morphogenesis protein
MSNSQPKQTPYDKNIVDTLFGVVGNSVTNTGRWMVRNIIPASWFSPGQPLAPIAQEQAHGRVYDYPTGQNLRFTPRSAEPVSFAQLRGLADTYDLLRLLIETRKDQICGLEWSIKPKDGCDPDARCDKIMDFLAYPDQLHSWSAWLRLVMEDMIVLDAPTIFPTPTRGGGVYALDVIDGTTITPLIDFYGRSPLPPSPAYQQIIHGVPAVDYTRDEIIYWPRNPRPGHVYGFGPVEQIIMSVNIALRRQITQLYTFTEGNIPEALIGVPDTWTPEQIRIFQNYWDSLLEGNLKAKSHAKFIPGGINVHEITKGELFGEAEQWLARVMCFAFSVSPQPFIKEINRATAQTAKETATEEGLEPHKRWVKTLMDYIVHKHFNAPDLEFDWTQDEEVDHLVQAQIDQIYINAGVYNPAYVANRLGIDPQYIPDEPPPQPGLPEFTADQTKPGTGAASFAGAKPKPEPAAKIAKAGKKKALKPINPNRKSVRDARNELAGILAKAYAEQTRQIVKAVQKIGKADDAENLFLPEQAQAAMGALQDFDWTALVLPAASALKKAAEAGVKAAVVQIGVSDDERIFDLANPQAIQYATERGAELVGKRVMPDGAVIDNPDAKWVISDTTRDRLRELTVQAEQEGWSATKFGQAVTGDPAFGGKRAMMIARTECAFADIQGNVAVYRESGLVDRKEWVTANDDLVSEDCAANGEQGVIGFEDEFQSGDLWPPAHPNCRCTLSPVLRGE